ncbi:unnamed protein product [Prorocentrum cordatum]|uniref:N-acetyltransferase domain-containing protein n=2 Tax=Prorocentrum cordatum TaxID=2364126 RepID=A0ABN9WAI5_9DINO|nr:unnamed protein product [Polarella glacialis]
MGPGAERRDAVYSVWGLFLLGPLAVRGSGPSGRAPWAGPTRAGLAAALAAAARWPGRGPRRTSRRAARGSRATRRATGVPGCRVEVATGADLRPAAEMAVRTLRWTEGWLDSQDFDASVYSRLADNEVRAYADCYLSSRKPERTMLVAKVDAGAAQGAGGVGGWASAFGGGGSIVGCIGCEVKRMLRITGDVVPEDFDTGGVDSDELTYLMPIVADLAVSSEFRGRGIAKALVSELEGVVIGWGYDEVGLLVEATNFQAIGVYDRLGYRLSGIRPQEPTSYFDLREGRIATRRTTALVLRKSLKPFPIGALENLNWGQLFVVFVIFNGVLGAAESGALEAALPAELTWLVPPLASLQVGLSSAVSRSLGVLP